MPLVALPYTLHVLAAVLWVGGMFFAWMVLRPAAVAVLQPAERLRLWADVFRRFFRWVWLAVVVLAISGIGIWHLRFGALEAAPRYVHMMAGAYLAMLAIFLRIQLLQLPALVRAVEAQDWPAGGQVLGRIRRLVGINLLLGLATIALASLRPIF
ncbi:CopD family protein [Pseudomonas oligotrophica]|uniref:CopD family protein n=1 Tax=Pseudomonas oligotrophica TaxID=2912055 RepID=UPI001F028608|nr:CopD family protein [Pseudomonas oligotrophica]MCF7203035.1 CopD family protein [Pseudomonas oligotrophica]